jgi:hypothetical protein
MRYEALWQQQIGVMVARNVSFGSSLGSEIQLFDTSPVAQNVSSWLGTDGPSKHVSQQTADIEIGLEILQN